MHLLFLYFFKLSVSLAIMYLFYQLLLRRLTFYNHNRWYLLGYSILCFFIPLINISPALAKSEKLDHDLVALIPVLENLTGNISSANEINAGWTVPGWLILVFLAGATVMLCRLIFQFISLQKIKERAQLISDDSIRFYQVDKKIIPFSFGKSIFINQQLHTEAELKEIIRHEIVHVRQKHTIDIIWSEILCMLNWYNPFAWFIRKAIRQNLEFIADNRMLANGMDKKQYQYLLLKVIGNSHFSVVSQFNFSSLKNRIVMMNKMKTAAIHLTRFLFVLPLLAVILLSFRNVAANKKHVMEQEGSTAELVLPAVIDNGYASIDLYAPLPDTTKPVKKKSPPEPPTPVSPESPVQPSQAPQPPSPVQAPKPEAPVKPATPQKTIEIKGLSDASAKPLVIIDGEDWPANLDLSVIDAGKIESINVLKGESATLYGDKGKNGVILITTKKDNTKTVAGPPVNVLYIIDGKPSTKATVDKLEKNEIKSVNVLKGSHAENKYGEKGKNGVVEVTTINASPNN